MNYSVDEEVPVAKAIRREGLHLRWQQILLLVISNSNRSKLSSSAISMKTVMILQKSCHFQNLVAHNTIRVLKFELFRKLLGRFDCCGISALCCMLSQQAKMHFALASSLVTIRGSSITQTHWSSASSGILQIRLSHEKLSYLHLSVLYDMVWI